MSILGYQIIKHCVFTLIFFIFFFILSFWGRSGRMHILDRIKQVRSCEGGSWSKFYFCIFTFLPVQRGMFLSQGGSLSDRGWMMTLFMQKLQRQTWKSWTLPPQTLQLMMLSLHVAPQMWWFSRDIFTLVLWFLVLYFLSTFWVTFKYSFCYFFAISVCCSLVGGWV